RPRIPSSAPTRSMIPPSSRRTAVTGRWPARRLLARTPAGGGFPGSPERPGHRCRLEPLPGPTLGPPVGGQRRGEREAHPHESRREVDGDEGPGADAERQHDPHDRWVQEDPEPPVLPGHAPALQERGDEEGA